MSRRLLRRVGKRKVGKSRRNCVFCLETYQREQIIRVLPCKHYFHYACLRPWFEKNTRCPVCRFDIRKYLEEVEEEEELV